MKDPRNKLSLGEWTDRLQRWIDQRTGGRVYRLRVETAGQRVIVHGYTGSYYVRQLALAAVLDALESQGPILSGSDEPSVPTLKAEQVELRIKVSRE